MAGVLIGIIVLFLLFFLLTRRVWVRVIKTEDLIIQLHLPLLALYLKKTGNQNDNRQSRHQKRIQKAKDPRLSAIAYVRIAAGTLDRVKNCDLFIKKILLPCKIDRFDGFTLVKPFGYQGLIYGIIAYLRTKAHRIVLEDNAIISSPDVTEVHLYFTVKLGLYQLIHALLTLRRGVNEEKKRARGV